MTRVAAVLGLMVLLWAVWLSEVVVRVPVRPGPVEVVYWEKWTDFEGDAMRAVVDRFNRKQDRVFVKLLTISGIEDKTLMSVAGGTPPDIAGLYGPNIAQYADDHAIIPLDRYCARYGLNREQYVPVYWDICVYHGRVYGLPSTPESTALHYNKKMLRDTGLDPEKPPRTIEEMDRMAELMTKRDGRGKITRAGFVASEPGWWNWGWGYVFGGKLWDGRDRILANSDENVRAFEWIQSYSRKYGSGNLEAFRQGFGNFSSPQNAFLAGNVTMEIQGVWMHNFIEKFAPGLDWGAAPFPHPADRPDTAGVTFANSDVYVIPRGARHPDEAFEFLAYLQSQEGMEMLCMGHRKYSPLSHVSDEFWRKHPNPYVRLFADLGKGRNAAVPPKFGLWPQYLSEMNNAFDSVSLMKKSPRQALNDVQARMQPMLDDYMRIRLLRGEN